MAGGQNRTIPQIPLGLTTEGGDVAADQGGTVRLPIGTAAYRNAGTTPGDVPFLQANGRLDEAQGPYIPRVTVSQNLLTIESGVTRTTGEVTLERDPLSYTHGFVLQMSGDRRSPAPIWIPNYSAYRLGIGIQDLTELTITQTNPITSGIFQFTLIRGATNQLFSRIRIVSSNATLYSVHGIEDA